MLCVCVEDVFIESAKILIHCMSQEIMNTKDKFI